MSRFVVTNVILNKHCPDATVRDTSDTEWDEEGSPVCEVFDLEYAELIAKLLNEYYAQKGRGQ